jgi:hypothetical protein
METFPKAELDRLRITLQSLADIRRSPWEFGKAGTVAPERKHTCCSCNCKEQAEKEISTRGAAAVLDPVWCLKCVTMSSKPFCLILPMYSPTSKVQCFGV